MIDIYEKEELLNILNDYNKKKRVTIIHLTHDLNEALHSDRLIVLNDGKIVIDGKMPYVFEEEAVMRKLGLEVPFIIELAKKLKVYDVVKELKDYESFERLVEDIWK